MTDQLIVADGVGKRFGGVHAVRDVSLSITRGSIHALVGENGAGKSTMLGMLGGRLRADEGTILMDGEPLTAATPQSRRRHGIATVYQELTIVPHLSAVENVFLGAPLSRAGVARFGAMRTRFDELCRQFGVSIPAEAPAGMLSVAHQQLLEIMRGISTRARLLLLDEPTAALAEHERESLYRVIAHLVAGGLTIVFVSHNLDEVLRLSDDISVMRDGRLVAAAPAVQWCRESLISAMIGRGVAVADRRELPPPGAPVVRLTDYRRDPGSQPVQLTVHEREIVGLWGLVGSGRSRFLTSLAGSGTRASGMLTFAGDEPAPLPRSPRAAIHRGIGLVREDRRQALVMSMDGVANYWIGRRSARRGVIDAAAEAMSSAAALTGMGFDMRRSRVPVGRLSGGNQQKVLLGKWVGRRPRLLLIDEPTRGVDVGAKAEVLDSLVALAHDGAAIVMTSSELEEVLAVAHRVLVFARGQIVREVVPSDSDFTADAIVGLGFAEKAGA